jgi:hypothetical protein
MQETASGLVGKGLWGGVLRYLAETLACDTEVVSPER